MLANKLTEIDDEVDMDVAYIKRSAVRAARSRPIVVNGRNGYVKVVMMKGRSRRIRPAARARRLPLRPVRVHRHHLD